MYLKSDYIGMMPSNVTANVVFGEPLPDHLIPPTEEPESTTTTSTAAPTTTANGTDVGDLEQTTTPRYDTFKPTKRQYDRTIASLMGQYLPGMDRSQLCYKPVIGIDSM